MSLLLALLLLLGQDQAPAEATAVATQPAAAAPTADATVPAPDPDPDAPTPADEAANAAVQAEILRRRPVVRPFEMPAGTPIAPLPYAPRAAEPPPGPVSVDNYRRSYEPAPSELERYYEQGIKGAFQAEQSLMGPLDGAWSVQGPDGAVLLTLVLNDPGDTVPLDGAWRDLRAGRSKSGLLEAASLEGRELVLRFRESEEGEPIVLRLEPEGDGRWRGELRDPPSRRPVVMIRGS